MIFALTDKPSVLHSFTVVLLIHNRQHLLPDTKQLYSQALQLSRRECWKQENTMCQRRQQRPRNHILIHDAIS